MFIADSYHIIRDTEEYPLEEGMIEKLDEMLTASHVDHFFSLPHPADIDKYEKASLSVAYEEKDDTAFILTYALWCKTVRNCSDDIIKKTMGKFAAE